MIADRSQFGYWECDLVMFSKEFSKANVTPLAERASRFAVVLKNPDRQSKPVMEGLIESLSPPPGHARRSITFDRGTEFTAWRHLKAGLGVDPWFCEPAIALAERYSREYQQSPPPLPSAQSRSHGVHKSIFEVDLRPPQRDTAQMSGVSNARRSLQGKTDGRRDVTRINCPNRNCASP